MSAPQNRRLAKMAAKVIRTFSRTILAPYQSNYEDLLTHDQLRTMLRLKPEVGVRDFVNYCLKPHEQPRLRCPNDWADTIQPLPVIIDAVQEPSSQAALESGTEGS